MNYYQSPPHDYSLSSLANTTEIQEIRHNLKEQFLETFFGEILSKKIGREIKPAIGLIHLSFQDAMRQKVNEKLTYQKIKNIFANELKNRLTSTKIPNVQNLVTEMINELTEHQSLLMMMEI